MSEEEVDEMTSRTGVWYILNDKKEPVPATFEEYHAWDSRVSAGGDTVRRVAHTEISDTVYVSTVFLGIMHMHGMLFETMVFRSGEGVEQERYRTWEAAEKGHAVMVEMVRAEIEAEQTKAET